VSLEHILDWLVAGIGAMVAWLAAQWAKLRGDLRVVEQKVVEAQTRAAVLEARFDAVPSTLREIKDEIKGLRTDFTAEMRSLNERVDSKADR